MTFESPWWDIRGGFIVADVIKWRETIWVPKGPKGSKGKKGRGFGGTKLFNVGIRTVCAEVASGPDEDGWVTLIVRQFDNLAFIPLHRLHLPPKLKIGGEIRRKKKTIMKGDPRRLPWSDESVRSGMESQFLVEKEHLERFMSMDDEDEEG
jgi:hypothetical protein